MHPLIDRSHWTRNDGLPHYTLGEEIFHAVTHGIGIVLSIAGLAVLVAFASLRGGAAHVVTCSIFGACLVLLYTTSTLYHAIPQRRAKRVLQILDHSGIYLLIAGTYTPFCLVTLGGGVGWTLFGILWTLAVVGIVDPGGPAPCDAPGLPGPLPRHGLGGAPGGRPVPPAARDRRRGTGRPRWHSPTRSASPSTPSAACAGATPSGTCSS